MPGLPDEVPRDGAIVDYEDTTMRAFDFLKIVPRALGAKCFRRQQTIPVMRVCFDYYQSCPHAQCQRRRFSRAHRRTGRRPMPSRGLSPTLLRSRRR